MSRQVLVLNSGSSSIKFRLYRPSNGVLHLQHRGLLEGLGDCARFFADDQALADIGLAAKADHQQALSALLVWLKPRLDPAAQLLVGHRVVHGGRSFSAPVRVDADILRALNKLKPLAPLHQPHNLLAIEALMRLDPALLQVACFDTAFHAGHDKPIDQYALPAALYDAGVKRYGFHGLSYEFIATALQANEPELAKGRVLAAHLGNGASLCALRQGRSIDSSMGFSALDGLMMGTRCGSIDPGVLLYLLDQEGMDSAAINDLLYRKSGLLGVSNLSNDMRVLLNDTSTLAAEAINLYVHRIVREAGGLLSQLKGLDGLVFTGGIGEHAGEIRRRVCEGLDWLGIKMDLPANAADATVISTADSRIKVCVIPTDEELMIARHTLAVLT